MDGIIDRAHAKQRFCSLVLDGFAKEASRLLGEYQFVVAELQILQEQICQVDVKAWAEFMASSPTRVVLASKIATLNALADESISAKYNASTDISRHEMEIYYSASDPVFQEIVLALRKEQLDRLESSQ